MNRVLNIQVVRIACGLFLVSGVLACGQESTGDPASDWTPLGGKADGAFPDKESLFSPNRFYFARIAGWDASKMSPEFLAEAVQVYKAELRLFHSDPASSLHCPDSEAGPEDLVHKTVHFSLRTSGNMTKGTPKSSYKIKFTEKEGRLFDMRALNLKSMYNDVSQMREALAWRLFKKAAVHSSRQVYAKMCIKDRYYGLYSMIEQVDKSFLEDHFGKNDNGNLYKAYWEDLGPANLGYRQGTDGDDSGRQYYQSSDMDARTYQLQTNDDDDDPPGFQTYDDLARFIRVLNGVGIDGGEDKFNTETFREAIEDIFDVYTFLRWAGVNMLLGAWDNYWATPSNYYLYNSGKQGGAKKFMEHPYFHWIPWDYDHSMGTDYFQTDWQNADILDWQAATSGYYQGGHSDLPLIRHLFRNDHFVAYYLDHLEYLLDHYFNEQWILEQIGQEGGGGIWDMVRTAAYLESEGPTNPPHTGRRYTNDQVYFNGFKHYELWLDNQHTLGILHYVRMRHDSARRQLEALRERYPRGSSGASFPAEYGELPGLPE